MWLSYTQVRVVDGETRDRNRYKCISCVHILAKLVRIFCLGPVLPRNIMAMRLPLSIAWGSWVHYVFSLSLWPPSLDRDIIGELWYSHTMKSSQGKRWGGAEIFTVAKMDLKSLSHLRSKRMLSPSTWIVRWANLNCHLGKQGIAGIEKSMQTKERGQAA